MDSNGKDDLWHKNKRGYNKFRMVMDSDFDCSDDLDDDLLLANIETDNFELNNNEGITKNPGSNDKLEKNIKQSIKFFQPCKFHLMKNCCSNISHCRYMHSEFPCKFFYLGLKCPDGEKCKFLHGKALSEFHRAQLVQFVIQKPLSMLGEEFAEIKYNCTKSDIETMVEMMNIKLQNENENEHVPSENRENTEDKGPTIRSEPGALSDIKISQLEKMGFVYKKDLLNITLGQMNSIGIVASEIDNIQYCLKSITNDNKTEEKHNSYENTIELFDEDDSLTEETQLCIDEQQISIKNIENWEQNVQNNANLSEIPNELVEIADPGMEKTFTYCNGVENIIDFSNSSMDIRTVRNESTFDGPESVEEINASITSYDPRPYKLIEILIPQTTVSVSRERLMMREYSKPEARVPGLRRTVFCDEAKSDLTQTIELPCHNINVDEDNEKPAKYDSASALNNYLIQSKWFQLKNIFEQVPIQTHMMTLSKHIDKYHNQAALATEKKFFTLLGVENIDEILIILRNLGISIDSNGKIYEDNSLEPQIDLKSPTVMTNQNSTNRSNRIYVRNHNNPRNYNFRNQRHHNRNNSGGYLNQYNRSNNGERFNQIRGRYRRQYSKQEYHQ